MKRITLLTVSDNGIGMTKEEMESNLRHDLPQRQPAVQEGDGEADDVDIIGQFGVGFLFGIYGSGYRDGGVKKYGSEEAWMWQSSGADGYTMTPARRETAGTDVMHEAEGRHRG
jgi:molecular chaperone HtpG